MDLYRPSRPRPSQPMVGMDDNWLYVPDDEVPEALAMGARVAEGDSRLSLPNPLPPQAGLRAFARWRSDEARYRWCLNMLSVVLGDRVSAADPETMMATLGEGAGANDRVYLYVAAYDAPRLREEPGIHWDRRRRMFYADPDADMGKLYPWMTQAAKLAWEAEQTLQRALTQMVQDRARKEAAGGNNGGMSEVVRPTVTPRFARQPTQGGR